MRIPRFVLVLSAVLLAVPAAMGQSQGSIRGLIVDPTGAPVPEAGLTLTSEATGIERIATGGARGEFTLSNLPPGSYRVLIEQAGYRAYAANVELQVNQELWLDVALAVGEVSEEIEVIAPRVPIDRQSATLGTIIDTRQLKGLPLDGRNFLELSLLAPGTASAPQGSASSQRGDFAFTVNGGREDAQSFILDGVHNVDPKLNTPGVRPPIDAIREFEMVTGNYDASFGRNAAGQVNVVTQSGTNTVHGTAYGFFRTEALDARNFLAPDSGADPEFDRRQYGLSIGGPIVRDRMFFFADYERTRLREGITRVTNVPTQAERNGNFSESLLPPPNNFLTGQPFPENTIPAYFIHPVGQAIANLYPLPNRASPNANYVSSPILKDDIDHFDARVDRNFGNGATFSSRYSFSDRRLFEPFASSVSVPGYGTDVPRRGQNLAVGLTQPFGGRTINELRFGYTRVGIGVLHENRGNSINQAIGLPELSSNPRDFGLSQIAVIGFSPLGDEFTTPQESAAETFQVLDTVSWSSGPHLIETGFDFRYIRQNGFRDVQSRGFLNFSNRYVTGNALADLLLGFPEVTGGARVDNPQHLRSTSWSAFLQDSYKATPRLTITGGLRYEHIGPAVDTRNRANLYDPETGSLMPVGTATMPRGGYETDRNNIGPRIGVAWTPDATGETVIRGGYGIYYNQGALATGEGLYFNRPFFDFSLFFPLGRGLPAPTLSDPYPANFPYPTPPSATGYQRDLRTPWLEHWSVSVQRQLGATRALEVAYVGSRGHDLITGRDVNQPAPTALQFPNPRPNPFFDDVTLIESRGRSDYDALQIKFQQRFDRGLSILSAYTLSQSNDDASGFFASTGDPNFPQDSRNPDLEYARSSFDVRHRYSTSFAWELPFGEGRPLDDGGALSAIFGNMEIQGIVTLQGGRPFTVALLPEVDNSNTGRSTLGFGANDRPNVTGNPELPEPTAELWFNTAAFETPPFGSFGSAGRNMLEGPGYANLNVALTRNIEIGESAEIQLRAEGFNLFNRTNLDLPDAFLGSPTFGQVVTAGSPRRCQLGFKLIF